MVDFARAFDLLHSDESSSAADLREMFKAARSVAQPPPRAAAPLAAPSRRGPSPVPTAAAPSKGISRPPVQPPPAPRPPSAPPRPPGVPRSSGELPPPPALARSSSGEHLVMSRPARGAPPAGS